MWIQRSTMLSPPGHNTLHIHEHNQLTQYTSNVFSFFLILQYDTTHSQTGEQKEGCLKKSTIQIKLMWRRNQCKVMDPAVVCHGNFLETPGPPKPLQAQPRVFVWFALKAFHSPFQKKGTKQQQTSSHPSWVLISHSRPLCMNVNGCSESMQNRIINHVFHRFFLP